MAGFSTAALGFVLLTASLVAILSRRLRLPYSVGLVVAGIVMALSPIGIELPLTRDLIFSVFLPPLIFEAALQLKWDDFRRDLPLTLSLAFPGVVIAASVVAAGMHFAGHHMPVHVDGGMGFHRTIGGGDDDVVIAVHGH